MGNEDGDKPSVEEPKGQTIDAQARKVEEPTKKD
jgi:sec-independent protein translocase protein TatA